MVELHFPVWRPKEIAREIVHKALLEAGVFRVELEQRWQADLHHDLIDDWARFMSSVEDQCMQRGLEFPRVFVGEKMRAA